MSSIFIPGLREYPRPVLRITRETTAGKLLLQVMRSHPLPTGAAFVFFLGHQLGEVLVPVVVGAAVDDPVAAGDWGRLGLYILLLAAVFAELSFSYRIGAALGRRVSNAVMHEVRMRLTHRVLQLRGLGGTQRMPGELLSIVSSDSRSVAEAKGLALYPPAQLMAVAFSGAVLLSISWPLGLAVLLGGPVIVGLAVVIGRPLRQRTESSQAAAAAAAGTATDLVTGVRTLKGVGAEEAGISRFVVRSQIARLAMRKANISQGILEGSVTILGTAFVAVISLVAAGMGLRGDLTIGEFITVIGLAQFVIGPMTGMGTLVGVMWAMSHASATRVLGVMQAPAAREFPADRTVSAAGPAQIEYWPEARSPEGGTGPVCRFAAGRLTVVTAAPEAAGQLTGRLCGVLASPPGTLLVGGQDVAGWGPHDFRTAVTVAPHDPQLFEGTILENVSVAGASAESVAAALTASNTTEIFEVIPEREHAEIGEGGLGLSGGQRQRIAVARALAAAPGILVLDNPTTAVDSITEHTIAEQVRDLRQGLTTVVISDSPAWRSLADSLVSLPAAAAPAAVPESAAGAP